MGKMNASDKIMSKTRKKEKIWKYGNKRNFYKGPSRILFWNGTHSFLRRAIARGNPGIIYRILCISLFRGSSIVIELRK